MSATASSSSSGHDWHEANQRYLMARLALVRQALERHAARHATDTNAQTAEPSRVEEEDSGHPRPFETENETKTSDADESTKATADHARTAETADDESRLETVVDGRTIAADENSSEEDAERRVRDAADALDAPAALDSLCEAFSLSGFERDVLLLCAGMELDSAFAATCAASQGGNPRRPYPTFSLALAALPDAHWNALTPAAPLRRWRLIEVRQTDETLAQSMLRIDERVLHYLAGISYLDERLRGLVEPLPFTQELPPTQHALAGRIVEFWKQSSGDETGWPLVFLSGNDDEGKRLVAAHACAVLGLRLHLLRAADIPASVAEREALARLWEREASLQGSGLLLETDDAEKTHTVLSFVESMHGMLFVAGREMLRPRRRPSLRINVDKPDAAEQRLLWQTALGASAVELNGQLEAITSQFSLSADRIHAASLQARVGLLRESLSREATGEAMKATTQTKEATTQTTEVTTQPAQATAAGAALWDACRIQARTRLDDLAQRIEPVATWDDLVLPEHQIRALRDIAAHVRRRARVYETWGFASKGARGLGISALFAGASGTGKTMAAEVIAGELRLDLYKIDLSQVVNKYIGETEKNLRRVFDAAEEGGAVLLFDEADALFGKRSEVKDSHDRYANIEISYLLQRMESYRGLAILTTNMRDALDTAFMRRLRFVVQFPFPDASQRAEIWRRIFPSETPTENLEIRKLARLNVAGGNIRNIALHAAFLAADAGEAVQMSHLLRAARSEYEKLEKPLTESESGGWL